MADNKRLRVSKACDSCRRKKVKCDAIHPLCTNCETFNYECTYNDPTKKRGPPKGKLVPMMTGYIEAIEARLHRMEGLLGGLVKDKDPRAEIVRAELDAMAREAEMTGLKLRRSKAYEEIHNAMAASASSSSSASSAPASAPSNGATVTAGAGSGSGSGLGSSNASAPGIPVHSSRQQPPPLQQQHQHQQQYQQPPQHPHQHQHQSHQQQQQQHHQHHQQQQQFQQTRIEQEDQRHHSSNGRPTISQQGSGYRPHVNTPAMSDISSSSQSSAPNRTQPMLQPSPVPAAPRPNQYHPYDNARQGQTPQSHSRPPHTLQHNQPPSSHSNSGNTYPKQHPTQHQQSPQQHSQYNSPSSYSSASFQHSNHQSTYGGSQTHHRGSSSSSSYRQSHSTHERGHSAHDSSHHRTSSGHSNGSSSINFGTNHQSPSSRNGHYGMESYRIVTHRPSLTAHQLSNPLTGYMPIQENPIKEESVIMPSADVIDHLLDVHFRSVHPVLPFLHFKTISDQVHHNESPPPHLLFAVLGLASRFSDDPTFRVPQAGLGRPPCTIFYERAKHFIKDEYDNSQMATIQAFLLMAVQQMGFCESQRAWLYVGMAIRMAQGMGLNKEPSEQEQSRNRLQCELRKRTWWSIYVIERFICAGLGRPLTITTKDCETGFPLYEDDESDTPTSRPLSARAGQMANFVRLIELSKIQGHILEYIRAKFSPSPPSKNLSFSQSPNVGSEQDRDFQTDTTAAAFSALDKSMTTWRQSLPEVLQNPTAQSPHVGLFLHLNYNTLIILLHRPEISTSPTSASLCTQAAATITDIIEILMDAKAMTSMFISCIYAIFSAGIVHFLNIPSVKKGAASASASPVLSDGARKTQESHTKSAKTNLKRCIDALKFLASHWVSAASRAKVLEDLLDLKHVSLKDLEVDTFKTSPVGPSWALDSRYKEALIAPRETQDKLRQQCRSKVMTIHSLLANDEDFLKMQQRRSSSFEDQDEDDEDVKMKQEDAQEDNFMDPSKVAGKDSSASLSPVYSRPPIGLGVQSPHSSAVSVSSPVSVRTDASSSQPPMESDPVMVLSTAKLGLSDNLAIVKSESVLIPTTGLVRHENGILTPMTMTTLAQSGLTSPVGGINPGSRSEGHSPLPNGRPTSNVGTPVSKQGAMLDPFSMPSSISFPDWNNGRRPSHGVVGANAGNNTTTVWTTDSLTHRTTAHSATSSPMISSSAVLPSSSSEGARKSANSTPTSLQPQTLYNDSNPSAASSSLLPGAASAEHEEHDLVWNDMPPTLGLDEWTAYIGAMMMRWLYASGHSSPRSTTS